jgi:hypothetical protein
MQSSVDQWYLAMDENITIIRSVGVGKETLIGQHG